LKIFAVMRAALLALLVMSVSGCAGLFGAPEPPAPIEDRMHKRAETVPPVSTGAKTTPLPEQPTFKARPLTTRPAVPAGAIAAAPALAMSNRTAPPSVPELSFPAEPLAPEDDGMSLPDNAVDELPATAPASVPPPALSPAVQSLVNAANTAAAEKNWDRAQAALERAVKLAPAKSSVWRQLAYTHLQSGDPERAREVVQRALSLAAADGRENVEAWRLLGDIEQARGDAAAAQIARANAARLLR